MKKQLFFVSVLLIAGLASHAQGGVRLNGYAGYTFDDKIDSYYDANNYYRGTIKGGFQWGAGIEFSPRKYYGIELLYLRQDTHINDFYNQYGQTKPKTLNLAANYIMLGGVRYLPTHNERIEPYFGMLLGVGILNTSNVNGSSSGSGSTTKFAWGIRGGTNIWVSDRVGLKLQAQLLSCVQAVGGGFYIGTGGPGAGVSSYSSLLQFGLGGGLTFKLGGQTTTHSGSNMHR